MHELSLAENILDIVERSAIEQQFTRVRTLHLSVPVLAGVDAPALRFALASLAPDTVLDGAEFRIDEPASNGRCLECQKDILVTAHDSPCPLCGSWQWQINSDRELRVVDLLVN